MDSTKEYAEFLEKVKRTIYVDNISPAVTESVLKAAFNQFGNVTGVQFIPAFMQPNGIPQAALVEMENSKHAEQIISDVDNFPFMVAGMPRPVRAKIAKLEMFDDRPREPGRKILCRWLNPKEPKFEVAMKIKNLVKKHAEEAKFLFEQQLAEEKSHTNQQAEKLRVHYLKLQMIDGVFADGSTKRLAGRYWIDTKRI